MKAYIQKLRLECLSLGLQGETLNFVESARNCMRRTGITVLQASSIISRLESILQSANIATNGAALEELAMANKPQPQQIQDRTRSPSPSKLTASDGQNVRHKEPTKSYTNKTSPRSIAELWARLTQIPDFYPDQPTSEHGLMQLLFEFGKMLRIDSKLMKRAVSVLGVTSTFDIADQIACKIDEINSPNSYLSKIVSGSFNTRVGHGQLCLRE